MQEHISIIENYKNVVLDLSDVLQEENQLLAEYNLKEAHKLLDDKNKLVMSYRSIVSFLIKNPEELQALSEAERKSLKEISISLENLLKENDIIIKTRMETSKSVMDSIVNMLKVSNATNSTSYGAHGVMSPLDKSKNSIALNQTL